MKYVFSYIIDRTKPEKKVVITAENNKEATLKFFDEIGMYELGCLLEEGTFFTDDKCNEEKILITNGC